MTDLSKNIRKIARIVELDAKIKILPSSIDKPSIGGNRGIGDKDIDTSCPVFYSLRANSYDFADLLSGLVGPTIGEKCSHVDTITGLVDFDTSHSPSSLFADVNLVIQVDGVIK